MNRVKLAPEAVENGQTLEPGWSVVYLRPDGWWVAGTGYGSRGEAMRAGRTLPKPVMWRVTKRSADTDRTKGAANG